MYDYFRKWSDSDLANYYVDVSAYRDIAAVEQQKAICKIMVDRFIDKYADKPFEPDFFLKIGLTSLTILQFL